jgi:hypothetical protein
VAPRSRSSRRRPRADLVELVDRDEHAGTLVLGEAEVSEHPVEHAAVVDAHGRALEPEGVERVEGRDEELGLGAARRVADDVDVALHELAVAPFCGRSARQTGAIWIERNTVGSSARCVA